MESALILDKYVTDLSLFCTATFTRPRSCRRGEMSCLFGWRHGGSVTDASDKECVYVLESFDCDCYSLLHGKFRCVCACECVRVCVCVCVCVCVLCMRTVCKDGDACMNLSCTKYCIHAHYHVIEDYVCACTLLLLYTCTSSVLHVVTLYRTLYRSSSVL